VQTNTPKKNLLLALLSLPFPVTTSAFAQSVPTVSVNPNPIDFGSVPIGPGSITNNKGLEVEITNTSQEIFDVTLPVLNNPADKINFRTNIGVVTGLPNSGGKLHPGEKGRIRVFCEPVIGGELTGVLDFQFVVNGVMKKIATNTPMKCKGVTSIISRRFSLKLTGAGINDFVDVQVKDFRQEIVKQLKCNGISENKSSDSSCNLQVTRSFQIEVKSNSPNFTRFSNATGAANCPPLEKVCTFQLNADSAVTAIFEPAILPKNPTSQHSK
jgi:hypothetical protein